MVVYNEGELSFCSCLADASWVVWRALMIVDVIFQEILMDYPSPSTTKWAQIEDLLRRQEFRR